MTDQPIHDPAALYRVRLARPVTTAGVRLLPRHAHEMTGAFLDRLIAEEGPDVVAVAERL